MLITKNKIEEVIPQRPPMVMIDTLVAADTSRASSQFLVTAENIFVEEGKLTEAGLVENIAQTAAAHIGFQCKEENRPVPLGFIASIKDLSIVLLPDVNTTLTTTVAITNQVLDVTIVRGEVAIDKQIIASCEMRIFIKK